MTRFEMNDDRQKFIGRKDFYCRYDFEHKARRTLVKHSSYSLLLISSVF